MVRRVHKLMLLLMAAVAVDLALSTPAQTKDLELLSDAALNVEVGMGLDCNGDLTVVSAESRAAAAFTIESDATGNGSVISRRNV